MVRHDRDEDSSHALQEAESALKHDDLPSPLRQQLQLTVAMYRDMLERERLERLQERAAPRGMDMLSSGSGGISGWHLVGHTLAVIAGIGSFLMLGITLTNNRIDDLAERMGSVEQRIGSVDQQTGSMNQRIGSMNQRIGSMNQRMGSMEQQMGSMNQRMGSMEQQMSSMNQRMGSMKQAVSSLNQRVTSLEGRMEIVQGDVSETRVLVSAIAASLEGQPRPTSR